jgi:hypothetical protein
MSESKDNAQKKPVYKRTWFLVLAGLFVVGAIGSALTGGQEQATPQVTQETEEPTATASVEELTQNDCWDGFEAALLPSIQAYRSEDADVQGVDGALYAAREPIYEACASIEQLYNGMLVYPEVVGYTKEEVRAFPGAALNKICYLRSETPVCEGYADYEF